MTPRAAPALVAAPPPGPPPPPLPPAAPGPGPVRLAQNGAAALVVYMAHYGPRRPPGSKVRLLSANVERTLDGIRQTVLDCRCAAAWLAGRPEIDPDRLGLVGTSLGSLIGGVAAAA